MSKPFWLNDGEHSEKVEMMRKAFEQAFNECWYCEENIGTSKRYGELICDECNNADIRTISPPMNEKAKAKQLQLIIRMFKMLNEEEKMLEESTDPNELMNWLARQATHINIQNHFKIDCEKFLESWNRLYGNSDNIPLSFKNDINNKYKLMRKL